MPFPEIVIAEDTLAFMDKREISPVILRVVKDVNEHFLAEFNSHLQAVSPSCGHRQDCFGEGRYSLLPNLDFKSVEFLPCVH